MNESIHLMDVSDKEKVIQVLALTLAEALGSAARKITSDSALCTCDRIVKTGLDSILAASKVPLTATEITFERGLSGSALVIMRTQELYHLGQLVSGVEAGTDETVPAEVLEGCLKFFQDSMEDANRRLAAAHGKDVASGMPELINPDGNPAGLLPLKDCFQAVLSVTFGLMLSPDLEFGVQLLVHPDLLGSLTVFLGETEPEPRSENPASHRSVAPMENNPMPEISSGTGRPSQPRRPDQEQPGSRSNWNIDLLLDVELPIVVSFGETAMQLKDVLKLGIGSVIELDKTVNDPVTLIVNQKPIARGEVVMVEGNYGVRILEVESTADRIRSLG